MWARLPYSLFVQLVQIVHVSPWGRTTSISDHIHLSRFGCPATVPLPFTANCKSSFVLCCEDARSIVSAPWESKLFVFLGPPFIQSQRSWSLKEELLFLCIFIKVYGSSLTYLTGTACFQPDSKGSDDPKEKVPLCTFLLVTENPKGFSLWNQFERLKSGNIYKDPGWIYSIDERSDKNTVLCF